MGRKRSLNDSTPPSESAAERICVGCGRRIEWRRAWAASWNEVRWCSQRCRSRKLRPIDRQLETAIVELLSHRARGATICPSEAARAVDPQTWRTVMEPARSAARRLVARGEIDIVQGGRIVDPSTARGPIRLRVRDIP